MFVCSWFAIVTLGLRMYPLKVRYEYAVAAPQDEIYNFQIIENACQNSIHVVIFPFHFRLTSSTTCSTGSRSTRRSSSARSARSSSTLLSSHARWAILNLILSYKFKFLPLNLLSKLKLHILDLGLHPCYSSPFML